jgi:hypothetical protein
MSTTSTADILASLTRFEEIIRQGLRDGTVLAVMTREKRAMVSGCGDPDLDAYET